LDEIRWLVYGLIRVTRGRSEHSKLTVSNTTVRTVATGSKQAA